MTDVIATNQTILVVGGGISGMTAALEAAECGKNVVLIEKNPNPLAASFDIPAGTETMITTRVKMGETSNVYALVKANGKYFVANKEIKVTLGGCGG